MVQIRIAAIAAWLLSCVAPGLSFASAEWIASQRQANGSIATAQDVATALQSTSEAVRALRASGQLVDLAPAGVYVASEPYQGTEYLARKIITAAETSAPTSQLTNELLQRQNADGGFGESAGFESTSQDTAHALEALVLSGGLDTQASGFATGYLLQQQQSNGAWTGPGRTASVYVTALAVRALWTVRSRFNVVTQIAAARDYLLAQRRADHLWTETHVSALALSAILPTLPDQSSVASSVSALAALEGVDGSYAGDVYTTALALQAMQRAQAPFEDRIALAGRVIDGDTSVALSGAQVIITGPISATRSTDASGRFTFESAMSGTYTLTVTYGTYSPVTATSTVRAGQSVDFGTIALLKGVVPTTAVLRGRVTDNLTGSAISAATVEIVGPGLTAQTDLNGEYLIGGVAAGGGTVLVSKDGYSTVQAGVSFVAGQIYNFSPQLVTTSSTLVRVQGVVTDAQTLQPLAGVTVTASVGTIEQSVTTDAVGAYAIGELSPGALSVSAVLAGYHSVSGSTQASAGSLITFSPAMSAISSPQPPPPAAGQIRGVLIDSVSGLQVAAATVQFVVSGSVRGTATTDADGRFTISNVVGNGELRASRTNYRALAIGLSVAGGTVVDVGALEFIPSSLNNGGAFRGTVLDTTTNAPRSGVTVTAVFGTTTRTATTNTAGQFQIVGINPLNGTARLARTGYESLDIGLALTLGEVIDLGTMYMRPVDTDEVMGDLMVHHLDIGNVSVDADSFATSGSLGVSVQNGGNASLAGSINIKAFSDVNQNGTFETGIDVDLGNSYIAVELEPGATAQTTIALYGALQFRDAPIRVWVDSENALIEQYETNNVDTTAGSCVNAQRLAVDLGLCMDASGSMSAADFALQVNGTAAAIEDESVLPRDGSVRLTVMQFESSTRVEVPPTILTEANATTLANRVRSIRRASGGTSIHSCINTATAQLSAASPKAAVRVIDISTDGGSAQAQAEQAAANAQAAGIDALNALAVGAGANLTVLNAIVYPKTTGPDAGFVLQIANFEEYASTIATKIRREARTADLTLGGLLIIDAGTSATLSARAGNGGARPIAAGAVVAFYAGEPTTGGQLLGTVSLPALAPGQFVDVTLPNVTALLGGETVVAVADPESSVGECNLLNNRVSKSSGILQGDIAASTDSGVYGPNSPVQLRAMVTNLGALSGRFRTKLQVEDAAGQIVLAFPWRETSVVTSGASSMIEELWNTELLLAGNYVLRASLSLLDGQPVSEDTVSFAILHDNSTGPAASVRVNSDRPTYSTTDRVTVETLTRNLTQSTVVQGALIAITVRTASGEMISQQTLIVGDLMPGGSRELFATADLIDVAEGSYQISAVLTDTSGNVLSTNTSSFEVVEDLRVTLTGSVTASSTTLDRGATQVCTSTVQNNGTRSLSSQPLRYLTVRIADELVVSQVQADAAISAGGETVDVRSVATRSLTLGDHACVLQAQVEGEWRSLAHAVFTVTEPPIRLTATIEQATRGRILVLVDKPVSVNDASDPYGPSAGPDLNIQRAHLEAVLSEAGWSYRIVDTASAFEQQFDSGEYEVYAVLSEAVNLPVALQERLVAAVYGGAGLLVAGNHDRRNSKLESALGVKSVGRPLDVTGVAFLGNAIMPVGEEAITLEKAVLEMKLEGATPFARYQVSSLKGNQETAAATRFDYGAGKSVYASFDLALLGANAGDDSRFAELLLSSLGYVHPESLEPRANRVLPLKVTVVNEGSPTSGRVVLTLPAEVVSVDRGGAVLLDSGQLEHPFALASGESLEWFLWVKLPSVGDVSFGALVQSGTPDDYTDQNEATLTLRAAP